MVTIWSSESNVVSSLDELVLAGLGLWSFFVCFPEFNFDAEGGR